MIDKSPESWPVKNHIVSLNHCGVSPLHPKAAETETNMVLALRNFGSRAFSTLSPAMESARRAAGQLFKTDLKNIAFLKSCAEGLNMIAHGFPFEAGDEILTYKSEYPSNHYPWKIQERLKGVKLVLVEGESRNGRPVSWSLEELESKITPRTKMVAISHVQFTSGFAINLEGLSDICGARGIPLIVDAAQSAGCMPIYPEALGIDALVTSGWKWLMGPPGSALFYTSEKFRKLLDPIFIGPDMMIQGDDYLNHTIEPRDDFKKFEYSTIPYTVTTALGSAIESGPVRYGVETIWEEVKELQNLLLSTLDTEIFEPVELPEESRSGILSFTLKGGEKIPAALPSVLAEKGIVTTIRGGYLRFAPHYYQDKSELQESVEIINQVARNL